ncbi:ankyrin repeat domain-containing protein [Wolbachia endosymbiont of Cimex lectularius]|uniref:ankyrin repeat domain-containing protein n=1 Tax=Wolbachia endosymbiont of Cimex lectularius TaxID=246273 RepID=UPI00049B33D5|nr:ankyrin repeat domain-containing protein [Wolbachia endosymbiont of Cimex lectularius]BAO99588.1 ankyrin repeat-containing protein [Wolbachia endosymbiont of Cimex lectularius]
MPFRSDGTYSFVYEESRANRVPSNQRTPKPLSALTKKLFDTIDDENLEDFKQALAEGADVNAFDEEGMTPLMSTANAYITSNDQPTLEKMAKLLIQNRSININAQSKQAISEEQWRYTRDFQGVILLGFRPTADMRKDTALHIACQVGAKDMVKMLLTHPDVETDVRNCEYKSPANCIARGSEDIIKLEFEKAQKGKELLTVLPEDIGSAQTLLNQDFNPNCWKENQSGEIETPLSLIIKSCLEGITEDKKEVLVKLLKHKELDFSQIKSIPAIEQLGGMNNIPVDSTEQFVQELVEKLEKIKAQPTKKDRKLNNTREESNERIHRKSDGRANSPGGKQNNYALTFFILSGTFVVGACLTIVDYPEISAGLAAVALGLFLVGYFLYKGDEKDIGPGSATDNPQVTSIFISSPNSAENFCTY